MWCLPETIHRVEKRFPCENTLCAWNNSSLKSDPQMEYFCVPETIHRVDSKKNNSQVEIRCAPGSRNNSSSMKSDPEMENFCAPETIHLWKTILK